MKDSRVWLIASLVVCWIKKCRNGKRKRNDEDDEEEEQKEKGGRSQH